MTLSLCRFVTLSLCRFSNFQIFKFAIMDEDNYKIIIYFYNGIIRSYIHITGDNVDENKIYSHVYNLCDKNVDNIIQYFVENKKYIQVFKDGLVPLNDNYLLTHYISLAAKGIINFNRPVFFKNNFDAVTNHNFEIALQRIGLCNPAQKKALHKIYKLIEESRQFSNFNYDDDLYKYAILYHTNVIGYIEGILSKTKAEKNTIKLQCFILPKFRKNNIAKFAHQLLFSILELTVMPQTYLCYILEHNNSAIHLYKSLGFQNTGEKLKINGLKFQVYQNDKVTDAAIDIKLINNDAADVAMDSTKSIDNDAAAIDVAAIDVIKTDFPYRQYYMPPFLTMYNNLKKYAMLGLGSEANNKYLFTVDRSFPHDYESADSIIDHFVEDIRIHCAERGEKSPYAIWQENKEKFLLKSSNKKKLRELVYKGARGCNLFNVGLGIQLFKHFNATSLLDCTAGWGDRLIAASIAGVKFYRGWDTNSKLQSVYNNIYDNIFKLENVDDCHFQMDWKVYCGPFEKSKLFDHDKYNGLNLYKKFDVAFLSPPFYDKELYEGDLTSTTIYKNINEWYNYFYKPMFKRAAMAVKPGGHILAYIPDGRMRHEANFVLEREQFIYLGSVAFRTIVEGKNPQIRDTFVWQAASSTAADETVLDAAVMDSTVMDATDAAMMDATDAAAIDVAMDATATKSIEQFLPVKEISSIKFKLGQKFMILSNDSSSRITSEEKFKNLQLNHPELKIMEIPNNVKKTITIGILMYKILISNIEVIKYYLVKINKGKIYEKLNIEDIKYVKMTSCINHIVNHIKDVELVRENMAMIVCIFSIDNDDVIWITDIYENTTYVCEMHEQMILNQIKPFKTQYNTDEYDKTIKLIIMDKTTTDKPTNISIYLSRKNIGVINIEKNSYGFEISVLMRPTDRKKKYINTVLITLYEFIHYHGEKFNELTYIESDDSTFIKCCKKLGLKDITIFGHESSKIFKIK